MREGPRSWWFLLPALLACLLATHDWWNTWLLGGHSTEMDYYRMLALDDAVRQGVLWPRFAEPFYFGYGSPLFHFYAPLAYWFTEPFVLLGASIPVAIKLTLALTLLVSGLFAALLARDLFGPWAGAAAGALVVLAPYHLTDLLARHAFGETVAFAWVPLALWGIWGTVRDGSPGRFAAALIGTALLPLTHNITAMILAPLLAAWWAFAAIVHRAAEDRHLLAGALAGALGVGLSAFFWLPALAETGRIWSEKSLTQGYFFYGDHFVLLKQLFSLFWGHGGSFAGEQDTMSFQLGLAHWVALAAGIPFLFFRSPGRAIALFWWIVLLVNLWMTHASSAAMWAAIPALAFAQFPWRFLLPAAIAASLAASATAQWLAERWPRGVGMGLASCVVTMPLLLYAPYTYSTFLLHDTRDARSHRYPAREFRERMDRPRYARLEETVAIDQMRDQLVRATAREDFLPIDVKNLPFAPPVVLARAADGNVMGWHRTGYNRLTGEVDAYAPTDVSVARFWFPGWNAWIDEEPAATFPGRGDGLVTLRVPPGLHRVRVAFGSTPLRQTAWAISLASLIGCLVALGRLRRQRTRARASRNLSTKA